MPETIQCPSCGASNAADAETCAQCNYPLRNPFPTAAPSAPVVPGAPVPTEAEPTATEPLSSEPVPVPTPREPAVPTSGFDPGPRPVRRRRERPDAMQPIQMQIWLFTGAAVVLGIIYFAAQGFWHSNAVPVAGAQPQQQERADLARATLEKDSTNLAARIELANVLYDTGNWSEAIIHYRSAERQDPKSSTTIVDLGVCYYNLSQFATAESLFQRALVLDPHQVFALFNLGIVAESQQKWEEAKGYFHRAMLAGPPEPMKAPLEEHLKAMMAKTGSVPPPLNP